MTEPKPNLAVFSLVIGCFVMAVGLLVVRSGTGASPILSGLMFAALGAYTLVMAAFYALPDRLHRVRAILRVLAIVLAPVAAPLAVGVIVAEFR